MNPVVKNPHTQEEEMRFLIYPTYLDIYIYIVPILCKVKKLRRQRRACVSSNRGMWFHGKCPCVCCQKPDWERLRDRDKLVSKLSWMIGAFVIASRCVDVSLSLCTWLVHFTYLIILLFSLVFCFHYFLSLFSLWAHIQRGRQGQSK